MTRTVRLPAQPSIAWNGWSPGAGNARFQTQAAAGVRADQVPNLRLRWSFGFEGDVHPLGYSIFSDAANDYAERPGAPVSTAEPSEIGPGGELVPLPLGGDAKRIQVAITTVSNLAGGECPG